MSHSPLVFSTKTGLTEDAEADLIIGADGAHSTVRRIMAKRQYFNCSQTYIKHKYVELTVPAGENKEVSVNAITIELIALWQSVKTTQDPHRSTSEVPDERQEPAHLAARRIHDDRVAERGSLVHR